MDIKASVSNIAQRLKKDKKLVIICGIGILGILLLLMSELVSGSGEKSAPAEQTTENAQELTYAQDIEERLSQIISSIDGAGKTKVMVTLENGTEQVYAANEKTASDSSSDADGSAGKISDEKEYVIIETDSKGDQGLVIKLIQPKIRGVAVVCEGGDSDIIRREIQETVTAVLDISASRVYVTKMGT